MARHQHNGNQTGQSKAEVTCQVLVVRGIQITRKHRTSSVREAVSRSLCPGVPQYSQASKGGHFLPLSFAVAVSHDHRQARGEPKSPEGAAIIPASTTVAACHEGQPGGTTPQQDTSALPGTSGAFPALGWRGKATATELGGLSMLWKHADSPEGKHRERTGHKAAVLGSRLQH